RLGLRSSLRAPLRLGGELAGVIIFSAYQPNQYSDADRPIGRRIGDYVMLALSHQRLADDARTAASVRERAESFEQLDGLLKTLAGALDLRAVFDRVSAICDCVMTHDAMSVSIPSDDAKRWIVHVTTGALAHIATPYEMPVPTPRLLETHWDYELVDDIA